MPTEITMPRLSDTMDSGTIAKWLKQVGDPVKRGEIIAEIETDKSNMELESYANGILAQILVTEGQSAALGQPIAMVAANAEEAAAMQAAVGSAPQAAPASTPSNGRAAAETPAVARPAMAGRERPDAEPSIPAPADATGRIKASPLARRLADEHNLDLPLIGGTGPGGRVIKQDVETFMRANGAGPIPIALETPHHLQPASQSEGATTLRAAQPIELTRMLQTIARRMTEARFSAPDFVLTAEYDLTETQTLLRTLKGVEGLPRVGPNDLLIRALGVALRRHPEVNSGWENGTVMRYGRVNVGFAVAIEGGLVVPVIRDVDTKPLGQIATEAKEAITRARAGKLAPHEYEGGTFSLSNLGMYGIEQFTPVINVPEACILGVGAIESKPVVVDGEIVVRERMNVTMSCDHRVVNGAQGAEFLRTLRSLIEHPMLALI